MTEKEWTKIMRIPCRDCEQVMSILTTEGANIIEVRCPDCTRVFDRKNALYNKEIGYMPDGREEPAPLRMSTLADNGSFGLEYLLLGQRNEKTIKLLWQGITFCEYIIKTEKSQSAINAAINIREQVLKFIEGKNPTEPEVRAIQGFFNTVSAPFLRQAINEMKRREKRGH